MFDFLQNIQKDWWVALILVPTLTTILKQEGRNMIRNLAGKLKRTTATVILAVTMTGCVSGVIATSPTIKKAVAKNVIDELDLKELPTKEDVISEFFKREDVYFEVDRLISKLKNVTLVQFNLHKNQLNQRTMDYFYFLNDIRIPEQMITNSLNGKGTPLPADFLNSASNQKYKHSDEAKIIKSERHYYTRAKMQKETWFKALPNQLAKDKLRGWHDAYFIAIRSEFDSNGSYGWVTLKSNIKEGIKPKDNNTIDFVLDGFYRHLSKIVTKIQIKKTKESIKNAID